ncbi:MAG: hypothetical protein QOJ64_1141 [Acidobacteriota bacterium]|jgi:hypothetical protein|nr:hypothetical protein [Acidobacteriota bacterium]
MDRRAWGKRRYDVLYYQGTVDEGKSKKAKGKDKSTLSRLPFCLLPFYF